MTAVVYLIIGLQTLIGILMIRQIYVTALAMWSGFLSDIPFEPTKYKILDTVTEFAQDNLRSNQHIMDLGSGDGRVVFFLSQRLKNPVTGVEKNLVLFTQSRLNLAVLKLLGRIKSRHAQIINQDFRDTDVSQVKLLYTYFTPEAYKALTPAIKQLPKKSYVIAWRYPAPHEELKLLKKVESDHTLFIYQKA